MLLALVADVYGAWDGMWTTGWGDGDGARTNGDLADLTQQVAQLAAELTPTAGRSRVHGVTEQDVVEGHPHQLGVVLVQGRRGVADGGGVGGW